MADFHQNGVVATLHNLRERSLERMEKELSVFSASRPITLILPSLYSELEAPALENIVSELSQAPYIAEIVIGLDQAALLAVPNGRGAGDGAGIGAAGAARLAEQHCGIGSEHVRAPRLTLIGEERVKIENIIKRGLEHRPKL